MVTSVSDFTKNTTTAIIILETGFNSEEIDSDKLVPNQVCAKTGIFNKLITLLEEVHLHQLQCQNTRENASLDLFCTKNPSRAEAIDTIPGISDHYLIIRVDTGPKAQINNKPKSIRGG